MDARGVNDNCFVKNSFDMLFLLLAFVKSLNKTFLYVHVDLYRDTHLLESKNVQPNFSSISILSFTLTW